MSNISLNAENSGINSNDIMQYSKVVEEIHSKFNKDGADENNFLGWLNWPVNYDKNEFEKIKKSAQKIQENSDILVVIGIGGSYLGARAVIEALTDSFYNSFDSKERKFPMIVYAGNSLNPTYMKELVNFVQDKNFSVNVISKSGTTTEPAIAFRIFRGLLEDKYGIKEARERIYVTTDKHNGALRELSKEEGYETFIIPNNIGGRYSVLTPVGLLPIAVAGLDIDKLIQGATFAYEKYNDSNLKYNDCYRYAVLRNILYEKHKKIEVLTAYTPKLHYIIEWWKQLFGESEGKDHKGIFPVGVEFTTDLHSLGQYIQDGERNLFETTLNIENEKMDMALKFEEDDIDGLNYLADKQLSYVNKKAMEGTIQAHVAGGVPNIVINVERIDEYTVGHLIYFFEKACAMSGLILGVNPFNQPGVEQYKKNMFKLLEKPGYEE